MTIPPRSRSRRRAVASALAMLAGITTAGPSVAQGFPSRPITIVVPTEAGSGPDVLARIISTPMSAQLGQPVVIENRAGAAGNIGAANVAKAEPDGHTLLLMATVHTISASAMQRPTYSPVSSFTPVGLVSASPLVLVSAPSSGIRSVKDLVARARPKPGGVNFASPGNGSLQHLATEMLARRLDLQLTHVPYKSGAAAAVSVAAGETEVAFVSIPAALPLIGSNRLVVLGLAGGGSEPFHGAPPVAQQIGSPFEVENWFALVAPSRTPDAAVRRLNAALVAALAMPAVKQQFDKAGTPARSSTPAQLGELIAAQMSTWKKVITDAGIKFAD
jgi:tripartite-type tricarboxylate transporter receptor subunit TctC